MKEIYELNNVFDEMLMKENKEKFLKRKKGRNTTSEKELKNLKMIQYISSKEIDKDILRLKNGDYFFNVPKMKLVKKLTSNDKRRVFVFIEKESYLLKYMAFILHKFDTFFPDCVFAFRLNYGLHNAFKEIRKKDFNRDGYILRLDIKNFFGSLDINILLEKVKPFFKYDPNFFAFLTSLLTRYEYLYNGKIQKEEGVSILAGNPLSMFLSNLYLLDLDLVLLKKTDFVIRYIDDIALKCSSKEALDECFDIIKKILSDLHLELNLRKTTFAAPHEDYEILGFNVSKGNFDISPVSLIKIKRRIKLSKRIFLKKARTKELSKEDSLKMMIKDLNDYFFDIHEDGTINWSEWSFPILTRTDSLKEIDNYVQNALRTVFSTKNNNAKYRITYEDLKKAGYRSLVREFYLGKERSQKNK